MFYASIFSNESGAFRKTGALRFLFYPEGRTYSPPALRVVVWPVANVRSARRIALTAESARQCCRGCGPGHHCLRGGNAAALPSACENLPPAALSQRQSESKKIALLSLCRKEKPKKESR